MYRYERHFLSFYHNPTILEMISIASQWANTDLIENLFLLKLYNKREEFQHRCVSVKVKCVN